MPEQQSLYLYVDAFVTEMIRNGVHHVCISPGSRSTPLAMVLAQHADIKLWLHIDERASAFFALGLAKATGRPVALVCTSGTAAANYLPAVVEARYSRVPLLVLTADRPHELRECGAPQAIDQIHLYGRHAKWFTDMILPDASSAGLHYVRTIACRAASTAWAEPAGPVHINFPFRDPLIPVPPAQLAPEQDVAQESEDIDTPAANRPTPVAPALCPATVALAHPGRRLPDAVLQQLAASLQHAAKGIIIAGPQSDPDLAAPLIKLATTLNYPILADPLSGLRCRQGTSTACIATYDALLHDKEFALHAPDLVLRFGSMPTSKQVLLYLQQHHVCPHIVVDPGDGWNDPAGLATDMLHADATALCRDLLALFDRSTGQPPADPSAIPAGTTPCAAQREWLSLWQNADRVARTTIDNTVADMPGVFEGRIFSELAQLLPAGAALFAGNSMPVRDLDTFFPAQDKQLTFFANRGANGIDGVVSSALGAAAAWPQPLVLVIGDLSFYHDLGGLLAAKLHGLHIVIVLVNNNGGGIFSFLPQAEYPAHFEALFGTPTHLDFHLAVEMYGGHFFTASNWMQFREAVAQGIAGSGLTVVEVRTDRNANAGLHREVWQAVSVALRKAGL